MSEMKYSGSIKKTYDNLLSQEIIKIHQMLTDNEKDLRNGLIALVPFMAVAILLILIDRGLSI